MIHWLRFAALVLTAGYGCWRSWRVVTPLFFFYFLVHLGGTITQESAFWVFGDTSPAYFWTYAIGSGLLCFFVLWLTVDEVPPPHALRKMAIPAVLAVTVARMTALECVGSLDASKWLLLIIGAILFFCGQVLTAAAVYAHRNHTALLILGILWLVQAVYLFGYLIQAPEWVSTGYWLPALLVCLGFLAVGRTLKPPASQTLLR